MPDDGKLVIVYIYLFLTILLIVGAVKCAI